MTVYKINDLIQCDFYRIPKAFYSNPKYIYPKHFLQILNIKK